ncbi:hypothetical protein NC653_014604 [Populus alba x Populus x berolinensis]|uniref:Uncharacterized protein n=1 Tax=Populus alba x Populus x berolinensis TaxID=444605 RepID=A0AAD6W400_9ROSI|nr:hypothetical protein NC653_014604 [Populus alba x Populus x berolinensis]
MPGVRMRFLYHLRCQAHHAIRRRTALEPAVYTNSMVHTRTCISRRNHTMKYCLSVINYKWLFLKGI